MSFVSSNCNGKLFYEGKHNKTKNGKEGISVKFLYNYSQISKFMKGKDFK